MNRALIALLVVAAVCSAVPARGADHTVAAGETLYAIARARLGDGARWREIAELNHLEGAGQVIQGQILLLPEDAVGIPVAAQPSPAPSPELAPSAPASRASAPREPDSPAPAAPAPPEAPPRIVRPGDLSVTATTDLPAAPPVPGVSALAVQHLWVWLALVAMASLFCSSLCLRGGCYFSLVPASFGQCFQLAFWLSLILFLLLGAGLLLVPLAMTRGLPAVALPAGIAVAVVSYLATAALLARRILQCRWRSVPTVLVMGKLVADALALAATGGVVLLLPGVLGRAALTNSLAGWLAHF